MGFDFDITCGAHGEVEAGVTAQRGQHVVVERNTGVDGHLPGTVKVELDDDIGFAGTPFDTRPPASFGCLGGCHGAPTGLRVTGTRSVAIRALARRNASFSSASPVVARR